MVGAARTADYHRGWASGHWWQVLLLRQMLGRTGEAQDMVFSMTQTCPMWSLPSKAELESYPADVCPPGGAKPILEDLAEMFSMSLQTATGVTVEDNQAVAMLRRICEEKYFKKWEEEIANGRMTEAERALMHAIALMDAVAVGSCWDKSASKFVESPEAMETWDPVRPRLAELFTTAGFPKFSKIICP
eukprot:gnl/MRDRNA2_/MRDRNA2_58592_c0_seq2.p1 gnl/MRDRNA2_/MRDRNA2_58592_c0~~gnl/MRDRNA2_/MRDRNA2_58592_c0_seq2.p1  ORF type:complete len:189 (+),score=36.01 gnl/MRDRNA2_/MRDRNA2_58592_c0_seq2:160-726(+)